MKEEYLECARIVGTHGVRGNVKADSFCDTPAVIAGFDRVYLSSDSGYTPLAVLSAFTHGNQAILSLEGITTTEQAEKLRGVSLYAHRSQIPVPEGGMLLSDMMGLPVIDDTTGRVLGKIARVDFYPASRMLVVDTPAGEVLLPDVPAFILSRSGDGIRVNPPAGMFPGGTV